MTAQARIRAYQALLDVDQNGKYSNIALANQFRKPGLEERDKALCTEIFYGTLQYRRTIDAILEPLVQRGLASLDIRVHTILRMSLYQLAFLTRVPGYAVIDDAVELCKRDTRKASGFINGVLRNYTRDKRSLQEKLDAYGAAQGWSDTTRLAIRYSYPDWLVQAFIGRFGFDRAERILAACNERPALACRVNVRRTSQADLVQAWSRGRTMLEPSPVSPLGVRLSHGLDVEQWPPYQEGLLTVQDEASMLIPPLLQPEQNRRILDLCAGLGTKATQTRELQMDDGRVEAVDIHQHKLERLHVAARRLGLEGIRTMVADARSLGTRRNLVGQFDAVLLDAPCSGLGVLRRRPEIRWRREPKDIEALATLQRELLRSALQLVRPGGMVVYATCTLLPEENERVVEQTLAEFPDASWDDFSDDLPSAVRDAVVSDTDQGVYVTPEQFGTDGFYMARVRRRP